jgi:PTH2 family peptidyl-tRNA hydrolase
VRTNPRMIIVMRKDLNIRKGKMIAQGAHAAIGAYKTASGKAFAEWDSGEFTKICVSVDSEEELLDIGQKASLSGLNTCLITDAGHTEFHGVPTNTCLAVGPAYPEQLENITGHLKLF